MNNETKFIVSLMRVLFKDKVFIIYDKYGNTISSQNINKTQHHKSEEDILNNIKFVLHLNKPIRIFEIDQIQHEIILKSQDLYPIKLSNSDQAILMILNSNLNFNDIIKSFWSQNNTSFGQTIKLVLNKHWSRREKEVMFFTLMKFSYSEIAAIFEKFLNQSISINSIKMYFRRAIKKTNAENIEQLRNNITQLNLSDYFPFSILEHYSINNHSLKLISDLR